MKIPSSSIIKISYPHYVVIDREAEIKEGDTIYCGSKFIHPFEDNCKKQGGVKILFTIGVAMPGIPLLVEEYKGEALAEQYFKSISEVMPFRVDAIVKHGFRDGFRAARSKGTFTLEQVQLLVEWCFDNIPSDDTRRMARDDSEYRKHVISVIAKKAKDKIHSLSHPPIKEIIIEEEEVDTTSVLGRPSGSITLDEMKLNKRPKYFDKEKNIITAKFIY